MNFTGSWTIVESPDFDDEYLRMETEPYVTLRQSSDRVGKTGLRRYESGRARVHLGV